MSGQDIGPLSATAQGMLDRRAEAIRVALDQTSGVNPDVFAEAVKIAPQLGDRPENIVHDVAGARELLQRKQFSTQEFQRQFPVLSDKLRDVRFMSMTRDDIGNLQTTEGAWDWIGQSWRTARDSSRSGTIGTRAMIEGRGLTKLEQREMQIANDRAAAYSERDNGFLGAGINLVGSMLDSALTGVAVAAVSGPAAPATVPAALYAQSFRLEAGNLYAQLVMNGHTPAEATKVALTYGSVVAGLEFVGIHSAAKPFKALFGDALPKLFARSVTAETRKKAFLHLARNYLEALAVEPTTEAMQEIVGMLGTDSVNPGKETFNFAQAGDVFMQTLKGMVVVGGVGAGSHFAVSMHKAADAVHAERVFKQLAEIEQESKLGDPKRSPDDRAEFVQQAAGKAQAPQVFIDGKEFSEVLRQADTAEGQDTGRQTTRDSLEKLLPGILEQVRVADETGSDVVLKTGDFVAKLGRTDLGRALMQHSRFDAEGYTPAEARKILAQQQEMSDQARALIQEKATSDKEFVDSAKRVEDAIYEQVKATGRIVDAKEARTAAQFYRDFVITQAARRGVTPEQFHAQYPLQVKREDGQTGARFDQLRTDTPEFKAWFGDSKVVDAEGKPQVYYHATGAQFSEFRRARLRGASFFSATPESAFTGASASANEGMAPYPDRTIPVYLAVPNLYGRSYVLPKGVPDVRGVYPANAGQESVEAVHAAIADALFSTDPSVNRLAKEIAVEEWGRWHHTRRLASGEWELYRTDHPSEVAGDTVVAIPETRAAMWWQTFERGPGGRADAPGVGSKALEALGYDGALISDEGVSTVAVFDGRRIKSVNNRGTFDPNDPNILRQNEAPAGEEDGNLAVVHNLTADKLEHADRMGGLAVPSLAIIKKDSPLRGFGDITLIGTRRLADPKQGARVFGADIYSPRYPSVGYKLDDKALRGLNQELAQYSKGRTLYGGEVADLGDLTQTDAFKAYVAATIGENASWSDTKRAAQDMLRRVGATERIFRGFTDSGNRKYIAHTLDNVVRILKKELRAGEGFNYGVGSLRARFTPQFRSIKAIKAAEGKLVTKEQFDAIKKEIDEEFLAVAASFGDIRLDTAIAILEEAPTKGLDASAKDFDIELSDDAKKKAVQFLERLRHLPTAYFEAKHLRAVQLEEFAGALVPKGTRPEVLDRLRAAGLDVAEYEGEQSYAEAFAALTAAMNAKRGDVLFQHGDEGTARGGFIPDSLTILLHEKADSSTFFHESAHAFLTIYADLAAKGDALATADMQTLLDWFGVKDLATWNAMSLEQQRKHHEKFAYSFEGYLYDGKAPSLEMQGLFDRFKVWLRRVYKTIRDSIGATYEKEFGEPLPILTGEVRSVMDRMLASEDAIAEAEAVRGMAAIYQTQEQSGMDDAAWAAYQDEARKAREAGVASLEKDSLRQMQWEHDARGRLLKAAQAQHKEVRDKVRREVVAEVAARPETRADRWLRTGRLLNDDGTTAQGDKDTNHKLDRATVEAMGLGPAETARLDPYLRADGLSPDAVAEQFGYDSGEGMLRALAAMKPFGEAVDARTTERMLAEHSELADPAEVEAAVERALHNEVRARFVAIELRHLAKSTQPVRLMLAAAKEAARTAIANLPFREASAKKFAQNEARAARQVVEALRKGDSALAAEWQQKRLLQHALATVAGEFQEQAAKDLRNLSRFQRPDAKLAKTRDTDLVNAARWVLSRFNLGTPSQEATATRALTAIAKYDAAMSRQLAPLIQDADQNGRDYRDLTVEQFRDLMAKVDGLWNDSKRSQQIRIDGKLMERAVAREAIVAQLAKSGLSAAGKDQPIRRAVGSVAASLRHPESWALEMDGGQPGPVHKYLFQLLRDPVNDFLLERTQMRNELDVAIRKLPTLYGRKFEAKELIDQKTGKPHVFQNRHELVGFLLHAGNEDNLRIDAVGRGWVTLDADGNANLAPVWRFIERMVNEGHLTKADFDFAQNHVWDVFESRLKARAQEAHKDNYGYYFNEIEAKPITVRFPNGETATYRGGYMPAKADIDEDTRVGMVSVDGVTESGGEFLDRHPSAPKGFTVTRTGSNRALSHDLRLASQAFSEELQFIHLQRPGRDLASILNDKEVSAAIQGVDQRALQDMFFPWLQDTMRNRLMAPGGNPMVNKALIALRRNVGLAYMFGNISNGIQQLTGFATSLTYVPLKHLRAGMKLAMRASEREQMLADSKFMLLRLDKRMGQITDDIDLILNPTWLGNVQKWTQRHGYFLQQWFQAPVDVVTWLGAKDHAIAQGKTNAEAIVWADAAVRRSQGSGTAADISRLERSSAVVRLLTQFGGFWLASLNTILQRHGPEQAKATATIIAFAGVTAGALSQALKGGWDDDDEDGALWDDIAGWAVGEAAKTGASLVPVVGSMAYSLVTGDRGGRLSPAATLGAAEQGSRGLRALAAIAAGKRDAKGQDIKDVSLFLSVILGAAPASLAARPISYQFDVSRGNVQPTGPVDYARGLATGTPAPGTKK